MKPFMLDIYYSYNMYNTQTLNAITKNDPLSLKTHCKYAYRNLLLLSIHL